MWTSTTSVNRWRVLHQGRTGGGWRGEGKQAVQEHQGTVRQDRPAATERGVVATARGGASRRATVLHHLPAQAANAVHPPVVVVAAAGPARLSMPAGTTK